MIDREKTWLPFLSKNSSVKVALGMFIELLDSCAGAGFLLPWRKAKMRGHNIARLMFVLFRRRLCRNPATHLRRRLCHFDPFDYRSGQAPREILVSTRGRDLLKDPSRSFGMTTRPACIATQSLEGEEKESLWEPRYKQSQKIKKTPLNHSLSRTALNYFGQQCLATLFSFPGCAASTLFSLFIQPRMT